MNSEIESQSRCAGLSCNASLSAVRFNEWRGGPSCRPKCLPAELLVRPAFSTAIFMAVWRVWPRGTTCHTSFFLPVSLPSSLLHLPLFHYSPIPSPFPRPFPIFHPPSSIFHYSLLQGSPLQQILLRTLPRLHDHLLSILNLLHLHFPPSSIRTSSSSCRDGFSEYRALRRFLRCSTCGRRAAV